MPGGPIASSPPMWSSGPRSCSTSPRCRRICSPRCSPARAPRAGRRTSSSRSAPAGSCGPALTTSGPGAGPFAMSPAPMRCSIRMSEPARIVIPADLLPADGRFGSGPTKVRDAQVAALAAAGRSLLGTSHRQAPVRSLVQRVRDGLATLFGLPDDYLVVLSNGGTTAFWESAAFGLVADKAQHLSFGEFSAKFAKVTQTAPWLAEPSVIKSEPGTPPSPQAEAGIDAYALTHNETSTGVAMPIRRVSGSDDGAMVLVDATSAAGGIAVDPAEFDAYYFAPQKCFASDGGIWFALLSPAAIERVARIAASDRYIPAFLSLQTAIEQSRLQQTYNTPALATLILMAEQIDWMLGQGGM